MNMSKDDSLEKGNLNYIYKKQTEDERFLDKVIRAESKGTISDEQNLNDTSPKKKITKDEIIKSVMEQAKHYKRDDKKQQSKYADIAKNRRDANLISDAQYQRVLRSINVIAKAPFIYKNIGDIKAEEIQAFLNQMSKQYSNSSIKKFNEQFGQTFKYAFNKGYITRNPMIEVIRPKAIKKDKEIRAMTIDEESKFVDYLTKHSIQDIYYKNAYLMQLFMGFRIGEVLALNSGDIDLAHHLIRVDKTLTKLVDGEVVMSDSPKTQAGNRTLPIPKVIEPYIIEQMQFSKNLPGNEEHLLFKPPVVHYARVSSLNWQLKNILKKIGIEEFTTHQLRHTYATRSIEAGMSPVVLQKLMGHTDVSVTLNAYTSVFDKYKKDELEKVNDYIIEQNLIKLPESSPLNLEEHNPILIDNFKENNYEQER